MLLQLGPQADQQTQSPQRIFLYNRQVLTGELRLPQTLRLLPYEVGPPDTPSESESVAASTSDVSALLEKASSPLLRALPDFERQFLRNLKRYFILYYYAACICTYCTYSLCLLCINTFILVMYSH